ncbi:MAG: Ig-like domain-containing protein [Candidatus Bipolaricaulia bacterium]
MIVRITVCLAALLFSSVALAAAQGAQSIDICEAIDTSGSIDDSQLQREINGFKAALNSVLIPGVNAGRSIGISIVGFSTNVQTFLPLREINGVNRSEILNAYDDVVNSSDRDLTNLGGAIQECVDVLSNSTADRQVIDLSTDGRPTTGPDTRQAANAAKNAGIEIWTLGIGPNADNSLLEQINGCGSQNQGCGARNFKISSFQDVPDALSEKTGRIADGGDDGGQNQSPVAQDDTERTSVGSTVTVRALDNDFDPDIDPLTIQNVSSPSNGQASATMTATIKYTPSAGFQGTDTFTYTISDGQGGTATATVGIGVGTAPPTPGDGTDGGDDGPPPSDGGPPTTGVPGLTPPWLGLLGAGLLFLMGRELWRHAQTSNAN